jgi:atypical dual specificity phosphatase
MSMVKRWLIRLSYYPSLWFNTAMCGLGIWRRWDWVDPDVLLGIVPSRGDIDRLHALGVRAIVNMCEEFAGHEREMATRGIVQLRLPTTDYQHPREEDLLRGIEFMRRQAAGGAKVYVHCKAGRGRAATMALCYLMAARGLGASAAYAAMLKVRPHLTRRLDRRPAVKAVERRLRGEAG